MHRRIRHFFFSHYFFSDLPQGIAIFDQKKWVNRRIRCNAVRDFVINPTNLVQRTMAIFALNSKMFSELRVFKCSSEYKSPSYFLSTAHTSSSVLAGLKKHFETKSWEYCGWSLKFVPQARLHSLAKGKILVNKENIPLPAYVLQKKKDKTRKHEKKWGQKSATKAWVD